MYKIVPQFFFKSKAKVPQDSILGLLIFDIFINGLIILIEKTKIFSFADDNTLCKSGSKLPVVLNYLEYGIWIVLNWFKVIMQ